MDVKHDDHTMLGQSGVGNGGGACRRSQHGIRRRQYGAGQINDAVANVGVFIEDPQKREHDRH